MQAYTHILQAIADGEQIEMLEYGIEGTTLLYLRWVNKQPTEILQAIVNQKASNHFRIACNKKILSINGCDFPEPERVVLEVGTEYYIPNLFNERMWDCWVWEGDEDFDNRNLERGLVHLTKEAAILHTKAALSLTDFRYCVNDSQLKET